MNGRKFVFELFAPPKMLPIYKSGSYSTHAQAGTAALQEIQRRKTEWLERNGNS